MNHEAKLHLLSELLIYGKKLQRPGMLTFPLNDA